MVLSQCTDLTSLLLRSQTANAYWNADSSVSQKACEGDGFSNASDSASQLVSMRCLSDQALSAVHLVHVQLSRLNKFAGLAGAQ